MSTRPTRRPLVAMTCHFDEASWGGWTAEAVITHAWYAHAVQRAGGRVVFVPPDPDGDDIVDRVDAVVITGGADLDPAHYGQDPLPTVSVPDPERDASEFALLRRAWELDGPVLGVCRGLQVMAVGLGGSPSCSISLRQPSSFMWSGAATSSATGRRSLRGHWPAAFSVAARSK